MTAVPRIVIGTPDGGKQDTVGGRLKIQRGEGGRQEEGEKEKDTKRGGEEEEGDTREQRDEG